MREVRARMKLNFVSYLLRKKTAPTEHSTTFTSTMKDSSESECTNIGAQGKGSLFFLMHPVPLVTIKRASLSLSAE